MCVCVCVYARIILGKIQDKFRKGFARAKAEKMSGG